MISPMIPIPTPVLPMSCGFPGTVDPLTTSPLCFFPLRCDVSVSSPFTPLIHSERSCPILIFRPPCHRTFPTTLFSSLGFYFFVSEISTPIRVFFPVTIPNQHPLMFTPRPSSVWTFSSFSKQGYSLIFFTIPSLHKPSTAWFFQFFLDLWFPCCPAPLW